MELLVLIALVVCAVAAMPYVEDEEELARRYLVDNLNSAVHKILDPLMTLVPSDSTEHDCELVCKANNHTLVSFHLADLLCVPACKELQRMGKIQS